MMENGSSDENARNSMYQMGESLSDCAVRSVPNLYSGRRRRRSLQNQPAISRMKAHCSQMEICEFQAVAPGRRLVAEKTNLTTENTENVVLDEKPVRSSKPWPVRLLSSSFFRRSNFSVPKDQTWKLDIENFKALKGAQPSTDGGPLKRRRLKAQYRRQDELIDEFEKLEKGDTSEEDQQRVEGTRWAGRLARLTFAFNITLLAAKLVAAILSNSLSIISSLVDSIMDFISGVVIWITERNMKVREKHIYQYPAGKRRLEPVSLVVLSTFMAIASFLVIQQSVQRIMHINSSERAARKLAEFLRSGNYNNETTLLGELFPAPPPNPLNSSHSNGENWTSALIVEFGGKAVQLGFEDISNIIDFSAPTIAVAVYTIVAKLFLFLACRRFSKYSASVEALALDHRNDVVSNTMALALGFLGLWVWPYFDAIGAIIISLYFGINWFQVGATYSRTLVGANAKPEFYSKVVWLVLNHDARIEKVDTVRAFHYGNNFLVEVDIVLPETMPLKEAHDIGESLQMKLEAQANVERAFVHCDYEWEHNPYDEHNVPRPIRKGPATSETTKMTTPEHREDQPAEDNSESEPADVMIFNYEQDPDNLTVD